MFHSSKSESNNSLLIEMLQKEALQVVNKFKNNCLWLTKENITPEELAKLLDQPLTEIITFFWNKKIFINQNQPLTSELLHDYCRSFNLKIRLQKNFQFRNIIQTYLEKITPLGFSVERPPVVSIMGHIDHGKTTLLDTINQTNQQKKEVGGITQKVTISATEFKGKRINFLDTPGHSIFIKMRQRGISLTDLVVLVVEAREGVMFQTIEIIDYLQKHKLPVIVFINHKNPAKTDNPSNLNKITSQLEAKGLNSLVIINGNAKKVQDGGINELLENIVSLSDFRSHLQIPANGVIIDGYFDPQTKHWVNELLIQGGKLVEKDILFLNGQFSKVKIGTLYNIFTQKIVTQAVPGDLVRLIDLNITAELGDRFLVINDKEVIENIQKELTNYLAEKERSISVLDHQERKNINLVLTANSENARQVLHDLVKKKKLPEVNLTIVAEITGNLTNSDLKLVKNTNSTVLLFGKLNSAQKRILQNNEIPFRASEIIYELEKEIDKIVNQQSEKKKVEEEVGVAQVRKVFIFSRGNIAGCRVVKGKIKRSSLVKILRNQQEIFSGEIKSLESEKIKENEISSGQECGIVLKNFNDWQEGDQVVAYQISELD